MILRALIDNAAELGLAAAAAVHTASALAGGFKVLFAMALGLFAGVVTGIPSGLLTPGTSNTFVYSVAGAGLTPIPLVVAVVGAMTTAGAATADVPYEVGDALQADALFGVGSGAALMCRAHFKQVAKQGGVGPKLIGVGLTPPSGGTAHIETITVSGTATAGGTGIILVSGVPIMFGVTSGDSASTVAAAIEAQLDAKIADLPVTASVSSAVVTCTHCTKGEIGVDVDYRTMQLPAGLTIAYAAGTPGVGVTTPTTALTNLRALKVHAVSIENRKSADITLLKADSALAQGPNSKAWRHYLVGDASTLSTADTLATACNDNTVLVVQCEGCPTLGGQLAAATAAKIWSTERPNANYNGQEIVGAVPLDSVVYTTAELETGIAAGTIMLVPNAARDGLKIVRAVTTKTTINSAIDRSSFDLCVTRTAFAIAEQLDIRWQRDFTGLEAVVVFNDNSPFDTRRRVKDMLESVHRAYERLEPPVLKDVDKYVPLYRVDPNPSDPGSVLVDDPFEPVSPLHRGEFRHRAFFG